MKSRPVATLGVALMLAACPQPVMELHHSDAGLVGVDAGWAPDANPPDGGSFTRPDAQWAPDADLPDAGEPSGRDASASPDADESDAGQSELDAACAQDANAVDAGEVAQPDAQWALDASTSCDAGTPDVGPATCNLEYAELTSTLVATGVAPAPTTIALDRFGRPVILYVGQEGTSKSARLALWRGESGWELLETPAGSSSAPVAALAVGDDEIFVAYAPSSAAAETSLEVASRPLAGEDGGWSVEPLPVKEVLGVDFVALALDHTGSARVAYHGLNGLQLASRGGTEPVDDSGTSVRPSHWRSMAWNPGCSTTATTRAPITSGAPTTTTGPGAAAP